MLSFGDLAPVIVALIAAVFVLLLTWHAWWQAHSGDRKDRTRGPEAGE